MRRVSLRTSQALSEDPLSTRFLSEASSRLGLFALTIAIAIAGISSLEFLLQIALEWPPSPGAGVRSRFTSLGILGLSAVTFAATRLDTAPRKVLAWGLAYQLLGAACMSVGQFWGSELVTPGINQITFLGVWIVLFPLVIPGTPRRNGLVALASASLPLLVHVVYCALGGGTWPGSQALLDTFLPYYVCAGLALATASITWRLGEQTTQAEREVKSLGSYQLVKQLSEGGMGEVWLAEHGLLARPAAIKIVRPDALQDADEHERLITMTRFEREAKITASLESPHTIRLYDFGVTGEGDFFYAMELLRGIDLEDLVMNHGLVPPARVAHILLQACESLAEAHAAGLVHRDIKPGNIYLCHMGKSYDFVKVLDFGLVSTHNRPARTPEEALRLTGNMTVVGTPAYMAPEQALGQDLDGRTDLYALGCVGYWLLAGGLVFDGDQVIEMLQKHISEEPTPLGERAPQDVPQALEALIMRCLSKEPHERHADAEELAGDLADYLLTDPWTPSRARSWWESQPEPGTEGAPAEAQPSAASADWALTRTAVHPVPPQT
jgi:serine/threonine protein kinase